MGGGGMHVCAYVIRLGLGMLHEITQNRYISHLGKRWASAGQALVLIPSLAKIS